MSPAQATLLTAGAAAIGFTIGASGLAIAQQWGMSGSGAQLGMPMYMKGAEATAELANNEGVYVDKATFKLRIGAAKGDTAAQITKMGGKEVSNGAIIVRSGDKLYVVDGRPSD